MLINQSLPLVCPSPPARHLPSWYLNEGLWKLTEISLVSTFALPSYGLAEHRFLSFQGPALSWLRQHVNPHWSQLWSVIYYSAGLSVRLLNGAKSGIRFSNLLWGVGQGLPSFWVFDVTDFQCGLWASHLTSLTQLTIWKMNMIISHKGIVRLLNVYKVLGRWKAMDVTCNVINHVVSCIQAAGCLLDPCWIISPQYLTNHDA